MEQIMELLFLYGFPVIATVLGIALFIVVGFLPPTAKLLLKKRLGMGKGGKGYLLTAYDDRYLQVESADVSAEGAMEVNKKKKQGLTFFLAKPIDDTANPEENLKNEEREKDMLAPYSLDGVLPVYFAHVSKAIATNPKALAALRIANRVENLKGKKRLEAEAMLKRELETESELGKELTKTLPVDVLLPFDPVDIKKNFPNYWQQSTIDATKKRHQQIGFEKAKREYKDYIWPLVIVAVGAIAAMVIVALATGLVG